MRSKSVIDRFEAKYTPEPNSGCWLWLGGPRSTGYGGFALDGKTTIAAHRASYELFKGPIPEGLEIDHWWCHTRMCVNPDHLRPATHSENMKNRRAFASGNSGNGAANLLHNKRKTHCPRGHPYSDENLQVRPCGRRACRACHREKMRRRRAS
jgi:hypothetical protein